CINFYRNSYHTHAPISPTPNKSNTSILLLLYVRPNLYFALISASFNKEENILWRWGGGGGWRRLKKLKRLQHSGIVSNTTFPSNKKPQPPLRAPPRGHLIRNTSIPRSASLDFFFSQKSIASRFPTCTDCNTAAAAAAAVKRCIWYIVIHLTIDYQYRDMQGYRQPFPKVLAAAAGCCYNAYPATPAHNNEVHCAVDRRGQRNINFCCLSRKSCYTYSQCLKSYLLYRHACLLSRVGVK
ncbi:unnamed protein product, partial [Ectocarpus sp. 6 AP-2014]